MTTLRSISQFKTALAGGGARPNLFEVELASFPAGVGTGVWDSSDEASQFKFLCKAAALPASNIAPVDVPFRGRILKVAGERTFDTWTVTVINDEDFKLRTGFERWMNAINNLTLATGVTNPTSYMTDASVYQLGRGAGTKESTSAPTVTAGSSINALRTYKFYDIFPTNISQIDLSYDTTDTIEEYTVEFQVQYWTAGNSSGSTDDVVIS